MPADPLTTQVIIVGAGPVGLMLAGELRLGGARVVVLEQRHHPGNESRASTLHARTMEILDSRGLLADFGTPPNDPRGHFGGIPLDLTLPTPYPGQWKVPQTRTEAVLEEHALARGADIRCGHRLTAVDTTDPGHVRATAQGRDGTLQVRGDYLVACDGEDSTVRTLVGADFPGHDAGRELLRADVAGITVPDRRFQRLDQGLAIAARRADGVTRVMVHQFGTRARPRTTAPDFAEVAEVWKRVTGEDITTGTPLWVNAFGDTARQLAHYRHGRILFAGDAAHRQMPVGGQALNLGLADAFNLGWKLALQLRHRDHPQLLDSYHHERHTVGRRVLANIRTQTRLLLGGPEVEPLRALLGELLAHRPVREHLAAMISGLDVHYPDPQATHPLQGTRLPPTAVHTRAGRTTTAELLRPGRGLLLDLHPTTPATVHAPWADRVTALAARPDHPDGPLQGTDRVLVRPDGHIAWAGTGQAGLAGALQRWFGPPTPTTP